MKQKNRSFLAPVFCCARFERSCEPLSDDCCLCPADAVFTRFSEQPKFHALLRAVAKSLPI